MPMDVSHFKSHVENIDSALETVVHLCKQSSLPYPECHNIVEPLVVQKRNIIKLLSSISYLTDNGDHRSKRAWIGGIGTILKQVFGTLDENDAIKYDQAIESLQHSQDKHLSLIRQNILITKSVMITYNNTLQKLKQNEAKLNDAVNQLSSNIQNLSRITNNLELRLTLDFVLNSLETSIVTLAFQLEDITNAIILCSQNILHPSVISPTGVYRELADNVRHLPDNLNLPVHLDISSIHTIIRTSVLLCYYFNYKLVFILRVPLVSNHEYLLYNNIALPTPHDINQPHTFGLILPNSKYIAITKDKSNYCKLESLENCKVLSPAEYLCEIPITFKTDSNPSCESELLSKTITDIPIQCNTKIIHGKISTFKMLSGNRFIYIQSELTKLSLDCQGLNQIQELDMFGIGILSIPRNCIGYCKGTTLLPKYNNVLNLTSPINLPDFNLITSNCCRIDNLTNSISPIHLKNINLDDMNQISILTDKLLSETDKTQEIPHMIKYGTHYSIVISLIVCFIILYSVYKVLVFCKPSCNLSKYIFRKSNKSKSKSGSIELDQNLSEIPAPALRTSF